MQGRRLLLWIIEISFNSKEFGKVLLVTPSMFGKLEVHVSEVVWRFEPITFYMGELRGKLILALRAKLYTLLLYFIYVVQSLLNTWLFGICSWSRTKLKYRSLIKINVESNMFALIYTWLFQLLICIGNLYSSGVWLVVAPRANTKNSYV